MAISQAKLKGNLGAIADYFLDVDTDLGDYYLAEDGEPSTAPPRALRPVTGAGASACRLARPRKRHAPRWPGVRIGVVRPRHVRACAA
jgi:hypothetical protein